MRAQMVSGDKNPWANVRPIRRTICQKALAPHQRNVARTQGAVVRKAVEKRRVAKLFVGDVAVIQPVAATQ